MKKKIYIATDHGGFEYKEEIKKMLIEEGYDVEDCGAHELDPDDDYTDFVIPLAKKVSEDEDSYGIILGRSGNGELMAANKVKGTRAAMGVSAKMAKTAREHNDANIISLGADYTSLEEAKNAVKTFLNTNFLNKERYKRRIKATEELES